MWASKCLCFDVHTALHCDFWDLYLAGSQGHPCLDVHTALCSGFWDLYFAGFQGQPGLEGPTGPAGYPGCNGTKVSIFLMFFFTNPSIFFPFFCFGGGGGGAGWGGSFFVFIVLVNATLHIAAGPTMLSVSSLVTSWPWNLFYSSFSCLYLRLGPVAFSFLCFLC